MSKDFKEVTILIKQKDKHILKVCKYSEIIMTIIKVK